MITKDWVRLPTAWIQDGGLRDFRWTEGTGSDQTAALMALLVIAHHANDDDGIARLTYNEFETCTQLSRAKLARGLNVLADRGIVEREPFGRSTFRLVGFGPSGWGKLPARRLYQQGTIVAFSDFHLRKAVELHALKLFFLVIERRNNENNLATVSYEKIQDYTGLDRNHIKSAISYLAALGLVHVEHVPSANSQYGICNAYRLPYIEPRTHMGTFGRGLDASDFSD